MQPSLATDGGNADVLLERQSSAGGKRVGSSES